MINIHPVHHVHPVKTTVERDTEPASLLCSKRQLGLPRQLGGAAVFGTVDRLRVTNSGLCGLVKILLSQSAADYLRLVPDRTSWGTTRQPSATWMAGGGIKPGVTYGETDEFGYNIVRDGVHVHDFNATILHLMGIDHERLTFRYQGRRFRLTDVHGNVLQDVLA